MHDVLVLGPSHVPLGRVRWQRAIVLVLEGDVDVLEYYPGQIIHSQHQNFQAPAVIRWRRHVEPRRCGVRFSREAVFARDKGRCAYCGKKVSHARFTYDHVVPRAKGGTRCWENIVVACGPCNREKRDRTPEEAGMQLRTNPVRPEKMPALLYELLLRRRSTPREWRSWLLYADWLAECIPEQRADHASVDFDA